MRHEARDQRQRHGDVAAENMAERQVGDGAMRFLRQRRIVIDEVDGGGEMLAMGDERALGMAGGAGRVDDEGRIARDALRDLRLQPIQIAFRWADQLFVSSSAWDGRKRTSRNRR